ncbi:MAG: isoleucine--tRNA ligase [Gemmatimonadetes bacterium]|nr:isoleucine--tRNA ligase [Gemmatimonadota bacterium]
MTPVRYPELPSSLQALEEEVLALWRSEDLFRLTQDATAGGKPFVFYEGPPTANGRPGLHHVISRTIKDMVCRYRVMQGRQVTRIAGWDTHGLPVEIEAEKKLGISGKPDIEALGIARFNEVCRESVFTYKEEWERLSERIGYWLDYSRPYVTFHPEYVESVWWILAQIARKGLLYRGHKIVPYCPRCGTPLSSHEVAQGYDDVKDPSLFFLAPWLTPDGAPDPERRHFVVWTTTPWTVPSNTGLAVHPDLEYVEVKQGERTLVLAEARREAVLADAPVLRRWRGRELVGTRYARVLDVVPAPADRLNGWSVVAEDFVSADDGTGVVHMAPAYGADDYAAAKRHGLPMLNPIDDAGRFPADATLVAGLFVKDADPILLDALRERGLLFRVGSITHSYPHCWRCRSPLLYMARDSWFAATSTRKDQMLANNALIQWHPPEVGANRFGEWLENNVDWALSRDRYWGTPLPVWTCEQCEDRHEWIGSFAELAAKVGKLAEPFDPHRPYVDELTWPCAECGGVMRRAPEVVDVWFDSGSMPYAQWHYPFEHKEEFAKHFPADFICEGLDQTRGWFYSLLAISTLLDLGPSFRHVVVNDLILDAEGLKMSKSRGNVVDPWDAIRDHGADAVRWHMLTVSNPWVPKRYDPAGVAESKRKTFETLFNTYKFFRMYAEPEGWAPGDADPAPVERPVLDRWVLSRLDTLVEEVGRELEAYQITRAYRAVADFVDELSNWYVRRSRDRFWNNPDPADARAAFRTLHDVLATIARLMAPATPFLADWLHRALTGTSAHLARFPEGARASDAPLEAEMAAARAIVSLGRAAREEVKVRVRQPLSVVHAVVPGGARMRPEVLEVVKDELNVKRVEFVASGADLVQLVAKPNFRALGPRFQKQSEAAAAAIRALSHDALEAFRAGRPVAIKVGDRESALEPGDLEIVEAAADGLVVRSEGGFTVALDPALDDALRLEGLARELVNRIQRLRKDSGLDISDRIELGIYGPEPVQAARAWADYIKEETLAVRLDVGGEPGGDGWTARRDVDLDGIPATIALTPAQPRS